MSQYLLLSTANPKTQKGSALGFLTFVLHLAPARLSGYETCPRRSAGCTAACLNTAGRGGMFAPGQDTNVIQEARKRKTRWFFEDRAGFMTALVADIRRAIHRAHRLGLTPVFRLNATSDLSWEKYEAENGLNVFELFPDVQFYDYTKVLGRKASQYPNYHLTFSAAENNQQDVQTAISQGLNVAVVFDQLPVTYLGLPVFAADQTDLRFLDPSGIAGLKAKGRARRDTTGFVRRTIAIQSV